MLGKQYPGESRQRRLSDPCRKADRLTSEGDSPTRFVPDILVLLVYPWKEPGEARIAHLLTTERCLLSAAKLAELISKVIERGPPASEVPSLVN